MSTAGGPLHSGSVSRPVRTCLGCRRTADQFDLLRFTSREGVITPDQGRRLPGRGGYLHRDPSCLALAEKRRAFAKALRVRGDVDLTLLRQVIDTVDEHGQPSVPTTERIGSDSRMNTP